jgi:sortase A
MYKAAEDEVLLQENNLQAEKIEPSSAASVKAEVLSETVKITDIDFPDLGSQYAMLTCEQIQLEVPVYWGDTKGILEVGVGQYIGSFLPGFERSILISGHNNSYFKPLQFIETGDVLVCDTSYGQYKYKVSTVTVMKAREAAASLDGMLSFKKEKMILYTCYPFDLLPVNKENRLFVFAEKISGPEVQ